MPLPEMVVIWRITERCNLGCRFCGYSRVLRRPRVTAEPGQVLAFGKVLRDYQEISGRRVLVSWLGGEPLLWKPLAEMGRIFKEQFHLRLGVTTNGVLLASAGVREHLAAFYDQVTISIDGLGEIHDHYRATPGLYELLRKNIADLRDLVARSGRFLLLCVNTILMCGNVDALEALGRELAAWGVRELTFNQLGGNDRPEFYPANHLLPEQVAWLCRELPALHERLAALGLVLRGSPKYLERIACTVRGQTIPVEDCGPGQDFLFIDEAGMVSPCSFTAAGYGVPLEQIRSPADLQRLPALFAERKRQQTLPPCRDCHSTRVFGKFR